MKQNSSSTSDSAGVLDVNALDDLEILSDEENELLEANPDKAKALELATNAVVAELDALEQTSSADEPRDVDSPEDSESDTDDLENSEAHKPKLKSVAKRRKSVAFGPNKFGYSYCQ